MNFMRRAGELAGATVGKFIKERLIKEVEGFDVTVIGRENLENLPKSFLLASNHLMPSEKTSQESGISPDALIIYKLVLELIDQKISIVQKSDNGWEADSDFGKSLQRFTQPFGQGLVIGNENIPAQRNPKSINRVLVEEVIKTRDNGRPILIFPEGMWYEDFDESHFLDTGAGWIATKLDLQVVPVYIKGATSWKKGQKVIVSFGKPFPPEGLTKEEVTKKIGEEIAKLQQEVKN